MLITVICKPFWHTALLWSEYIPCYESPADIYIFALS